MTHTCLLAECAEWNVGIQKKVIYFTFLGKKTKKSKKNKESPPRDEKYNIFQVSPLEQLEIKKEIKFISSLSQ